MTFGDPAAVAAFAGPDAAASVVPPAAQALLERHDARSQHYELIARHEGQRNPRQSSSPAGSSPRSGGATSSSSPGSSPRTSSQRTAARDRPAPGTSCAISASSPRSLRTSTSTPLRRRHGGRRRLRRAHPSAPFPPPTTSSSPTAASCGAPSSSTPGAPGSRRMTPRSTDRPLHPVAVTGSPADPSFAASPVLTRTATPSLDCIGSMNGSDQSALVTVTARCDPASRPGSPDPAPQGRGQARIAVTPFQQNRRQSQRTATTSATATGCCAAQLTHPCQCDSSASRMAGEDAGSGMG